MSDLLYTIPFTQLNLWDVKRFNKIKIKSNFPIDFLGNYVNEETTKINLNSKPDTKFKILGISNDKGMVDAYESFGKDFNQPYKIVENGYIAYNPYRINVGSIGIKTEKTSGNYISPAYVVFSCKDTILPEYLFLLMKSQTFNNIVKETTSGSVRQNLTFTSLSNIKIPIPEINIQKDIVREYNNICFNIKQNFEKLNKEFISFKSKLIKNNEYSENISLIKICNYSNIKTWKPYEIFVSDNIFTTKYKLYPLGYFLYEDKIKYIKINDSVLYNILGVKLYGKGVFHSNSSKGSELHSIRYQEIPINSLFWCKVDTKKGGFGVVNESYNNYIASSNMTYLKIDSNKINPFYLQMFFKIPEFTNILDATVVGTTNRRYISKSSLLNNIYIPLPSILEQDELIKPILFYEKQNAELNKKLLKFFNDFENFIFL